MAECEHIQEEFSGYLDGELAPDEYAAVEEHLAECAECLRALDRMKQVDTVFARLEAVAAPQGFENSVNQALRPKTIKFPRQIFAGSLLAAAAAVTLMIFVVPEQVNAPMQIVKQDTTAESSEADASRSVESLRAQVPAAEAPSPAEETAFFKAEPSVESDTGGLDAQGRVGLSSANELGDVASPAPAKPEPKRVALAERERPDSVATTENLELEEGFARGDVAVGFSEPAERSEEMLLDALDSEIIAGEFGAVAADEMANAPTAQALPTVSVEDEFDQIAGARDFDDAPGDAPARSAAAGAEPIAESAGADKKSKDSQYRQEARKAGSARTFEVRDGVWYETGYAAQPVDEIARDSGRLAELLREDPSIQRLLENDARLVFSVGDAWYALPVVRR